MMKRFITSLVMVAMTISAIGAPTVAIAQSFTGPWTWTDISSQLTPRTNRPVWTVAYANGNWFYSDGLDLWNSGQVYRYDGFTQTNITVDVRSAGLNRVDDIVSDGQSVLFLQDVVALNNNLRVVAYKNGQYLNITQGVRNVLNTNEGVSSITGRNGVWYVVTTQPRVFRWDASYSNPVQVSLPSFVTDNVDGRNAMLKYNVNQGSANAGSGERLPVAMVPVNSQWLLMVDPANGPVRFYRYDGSNYNDVTNNFPTTDAVNKIVSNGSTALVAASGPNGSWTRMTDGFSTADVSNLSGTLSNAVVGWNGKSWMIIRNKDIFRVNGSMGNQTAESFGRAADLVLDISGDQSGRFLLGGALSETWMNDPSFPLTAKLVMVTEGVATPRVLGVSDTTNGSQTTTGNFGGDRVYTSNAGPRLVVQGSPSTFRVGNGDLFTYRVTATDNDNIDRTDIYVNDARVRTCSTQICEYRTNYWTNGAASRSVKFWARSTDRRGNITDTMGSPDFLTVDATITTPPPVPVPPPASQDQRGSNWTWLEPVYTTLITNQNVGFYVGANDGDGINRIEIVVNGGVRQTCNLGNAMGNQTCATRLFGNDYSPGTSIFVNAKITDSRGNVAWTSGTTILRANDGVTTPPNNGSNNANPSVWTSFSPSDTTLRVNQNVTFTGNAWDNDGIRRIEIFVNGSVKRSCEFGTAFGNQSCAVTLFANDYTNGTNVAVNAQATDAFGRETWSDMTNFFRANDGSSNTPSTLSVWTDPSATTLTANQHVTFNARAQDADGLHIIELYVNDSPLLTCPIGAYMRARQPHEIYDAHTCREEVFANNYPLGSTIVLKALMRDSLGNVTSRSLNIFRANDAGSNGTNPAILSIWTQPTSRTLVANQMITVNVSAQDHDGLQRLEWYVDGTFVRTCTPPNPLDRVTCDYGIHGDHYAPGATVRVNARAIDVFGNATWTETVTLTRANDTVTPPSGSSQKNPSVWEWLQPNTGSISRKESLLYTLGAWDENGVRSIRIVVNGNTWRTCELGTAFGNQECRVTLFGRDFDRNTNVFVNAVAKDAFGNETWSGGKTFRINGN